MNRLALLIFCLLGLLNCSNRYKTVAVARVANTENTPDVIKTSAVSVPKAHTTVMKINIHQPQAARVTLTAKCGDDEKTLTFGESLANYRKRRAREITEARRDTARFAGSLAEGLIGRQGVRARGDSRTPNSEASAEVAAEVSPEAMGEAAASSISEAVVPSGDVGGGTTTEKLQFRNVEGQCWAYLTSDDGSDISATTLTLDIEQRLDMRKRRKQAEGNFAVAVTRRLKAHGAIEPPPEKVKVEATARVRRPLLPAYNGKTKRLRARQAATLDFHAAAQARLETAGANKQRPAANEERGAGNKQRGADVDINIELELSKKLQAGKKRRQAGAAFAVAALGRLKACGAIDSRGRSSVAKPSLVPRYTGRRNSLKTQQLATLRFYDSACSRLEASGASNKVYQGGYGVTVTGYLRTCGAGSYVARKPKQPRTRKPRRQWRGGFGRSVTKYLWQCGADPYLHVRRQIAAREKLQDERLAASLFLEQARGRLYASGALDIPLYRTAPEAPRQSHPMPVAPPVDASGTVETTVVVSPRPRARKKVRQRPPRPSDPPVIPRPPRPRGHAAWVPGHWVWRNTQWVWIRGFWQATGDVEVEVGPIKIRGKLRIP